MIFFQETSDSSIFYRPSSAVGTSDISSTAISDYESSRIRSEPEIKLSFQKVETVYIRPVMICEKAEKS